MSEEQNDQTLPFTLERIYIKDISYEAPAVPLIFAQEARPNLNVELSIRHRALDKTQGIHEVVLHVNATAAQEEKTIFLVELQQAGVFACEGANGESLEKILEIDCASVLLPFAREAINDLVGRGGFPQLLIAPVNFERLYARKQAAKQAALKERAPH